MRKLFVAILALAGASSLLMPVREYAYADEISALPPLGGGPWGQKNLRGAGRSARLRTAQDGVDPDTVWIGHIKDPLYDAGGTMTPGGYGPYRVGRGPNRPTRGGLAAGGISTDNGTWDFDRFQGASAGHPEAEQDSLQGWWPIARPFRSNGGQLDYKRPFFGLDHGNQVNYVINQGAPKRTFGVTGLWHRDRGSLNGGATPALSPDSIAFTNVQPVLWSPVEVGGIGSTASAWMGMRSHGDLSHVDLATQGGTGNPFNAALLQYQGPNSDNQLGSNSANGTDHNFPGYGSQVDQMLYRDIVLATDASPLVINWSYSTNMSTGKNTGTPGRVGWFDKDPLSPAKLGFHLVGTATSDGNFISSDVAGAANAPVDSFMVYVGAPVNDNNVKFSAVTALTTVYDKKRRWFSEVLQLEEVCTTAIPCQIIGKELASYAGNHLPTFETVDVKAKYPAALQAILNADGASGNGGTVRLVFRVKTNRGFDDEGNGVNPYSSGTRGAAIVDNVVVNSWAAAEGNFESATGTGRIDNKESTSATAAWKSTGKPPGVYFHAHLLTDGLPYKDPCGDIDNNPNRQCNLLGKIITSGDHDLAEAEGGIYDSNLMDRQRWFVSPTINLKSSGNGAGNYNAMGIDDDIAKATGDITIFWDMYTGGITSGRANFISVAYQVYPAQQENGNISWGETRSHIGFYTYDPRVCLQTFSPGGGASLLTVTSAADGQPDSLRVYIQRIQRCYTNAASVAACSPNDENSGSYLDNFSIALIDANSSVAQEITVDPWNLFNDAFPANDLDALIPAGFDTCAAQIRSTVNVAEKGEEFRNNISGDSVWVTAQGNNVRVDLVFRILPGPGNYVTIGTKASGVCKRPDLSGVNRVAATSGDGTFFGEYMKATGEFGSSLNHIGKGPGGSNWSQQIWNSARMDTMQNNLFPCANSKAAINQVVGNFMSTYHESDPKFAILGINKPLCVMFDPTGAGQDPNIKCNGVVSDFDNYGIGSGWNGSALTRTSTKILPDGLLTPGSHVQYFFRKSTVGAPTGPYFMGPDTNFVFSGADDSIDGHRWQQFAVLPNRWKDAWGSGDGQALAPACMLVVDIGDRRGNERVWVGIADSMGATSVAQYGAHNGWHARGDQDITVAISTDPSIAVYTHGGGPGTVWDMFGTKAGESGTSSVEPFGSRIHSAESTPVALRAGKESKNGPTGLMLTQYYRVLFLLTGDVDDAIGPYDGREDDTVALIKDFASSTEPLNTQPRAIWVMGKHFVEGQRDLLNHGTGHLNFVEEVFGAKLRAIAYREFAQNNDLVVDLVPNGPIATDGSRYSVVNDCFTTNDVLSPVIAYGGVMAGQYPNTTSEVNPKISSIYAPSTLPAIDTHPANTLVEGFDIADFGTWNSSSPIIIPAIPLTSHGRIAYLNNVITNLFASLGCVLAAGGPVSVGENPNNALINFLALRSENPHRGGNAQISFGITRKEHVELKVYDVTGRLVKTLANREFAAGEHNLFWDGTSEEGQLVARGVYFYQLRTPSFVSQKKLAVLKH